MKFLAVIVIEPRLKGFRDLLAIPMSCAEETLRRTPQRIGRNARIDEARSKSLLSCAPTHFDEPATKTPGCAALEAVFRIEFPRRVAGLARVMRDVGRAEELAQDALVVALERWRSTACLMARARLMTTAKRRAIDGARHQRIAEAKHEQLAREPEPASVADALIDQLDDDVGDDLLRLVFTACYAVLSFEARVALTRIDALAGRRARRLRRARDVSPAPGGARRSAREAGAQ
jgi:DNA-directed RNA polymerase specialized sigma24 family protein